MIEFIAAIIVIILAFGGLIYSLIKPNVVLGILAVFIIIIGIIICLQTIETSNYQDFCQENNMSFTKAFNNHEREFCSKTINDTIILKEFITLDGGFAFIGQ